MADQPDSNVTPRWHDGDTHPTYVDIDKAEQEEKLRKRTKQTAERLKTILPSRYTLGEPLGAGGFGDVFKAYDVPLNSRPVAIKALREYNQQNLRKAFEREAHHLASLDHPNVVRIFEYGESQTEGLAYIVQEFVNGDRLTEYLPAQREPGAPPKYLLDLEQTHRLLTDLAAALTAIHENEIVHRDIKPANILVSTAHAGYSNFIKLVDFGIAHGIFDQEVASIRAGTRAYAAPEVFASRREEISTPADIYAFGMIAYELLAGRTAFKHLETRERIKEMVDPPKRIVAGRHLDGHIPGGLEALILKALEWKADDRPPANEILDKLNRGLDALRTKPLRLKRTRPHNALSSAALEVEQDHVLGRKQVEDLSVDMKHCHIFRDGRGHWFVEDLNSTNGSSLNGESLNSGSKHELFRGNRLSLGLVEFEIT